MDGENLANDKSDSSSFEDLSIPNEMLDKKIDSSDSEKEEIKDEIVGDKDTKIDENIVDILGNGQLVKKVLQAGVPDSRPLRYDLCTIKFKSILPDGTVLEDEECYHVQIGDCDVIQGLDLALPLMDVLEEAELTVAARFAYGDLGLDNKVPPNTNMKYLVTLLSAKPENDLESKNIAARKIIGNKKRERGNWWYSRGEANLAIQIYRRALEYLDDIDGGITEPTEDGEMKVTDSDLQDLLEDRVKVYNNMAAAQMKVQAYDAALTSLDNVLRCQPNNVKALFRKGTIQGNKGDTSAALSTLTRALALDPTSQVTQQELARLQARTKQESKHEKNLYKKMLGQNVSKGGCEDKATASKTNKKDNKMRTWVYLIGTVAVGLAGVVVYRLRYM